MKELKRMRCRKYEEWKPTAACDMFLEDLIMLVGHLKKHGYDVHPLHVDAAWTQHSDDLCAGWLIVGDYPDSNVENLLKYLAPID